MTYISQKIVTIEVAQKESAQRVDEVRAQVSMVETKAVKVENTFHMIEGDFKQLKVNSRRLENVDNLCNLRLKGLKEGMEEHDLKTYLETLLTSCLGSSDTEEVIQLTFSH